ncbi:zf-DNL-domain-containing protein [Dendrothele bispora CBS 962.96]|uniref:Zf-DNL-domain-containing protein n=1 Tax=Dendrothele bispora (strain CBS 962.96) TaxID=1314807 RepID=A0A4S8KVG2_DENBC|nr:zf-DNL-domain-containing protein [Dendrothele bispora CBS 962.96]
MFLSRTLKPASTSAILKTALRSPNASSKCTKYRQLHLKTTSFASQRSRPTPPGFLCSLRAYSALPTTGNSKETSNNNPSSSSSSSAPSITLDVSTEEPVKVIEPRLQMTFTCTVPDCGTRSTHEFTKRAYERGIVLVQCPGCHNRHLIADHLGWFKESTEDGKLKTVEDLLKARGEIVKRGRLHADGDIEYVED